MVPLKAFLVGPVVSLLRVSWDSTNFSGLLFIFGMSSLALRALQLTALGFYSSHYAGIQAAVSTTRIAV
jgi:hypothetical protein